MFPYNTKLFRRDPREMTADWVSWAVPRPNLREVVHGALGLANLGMGYNSTFRYPRVGGIGVLPEAIARRVANLRLHARVETIDARRRSVTLASGETVGYDRLVSTIPLPALLRRIEGAGEDLRKDADRLEWSVVGCLNLGMDREGIGNGAHWIYFPDADAPFY